MHADGDVVDGEIIMCGGYEKISASARAECYKFDQGTNSWTLLAMLDSGLNRCVSFTLFKFEFICNCQFCLKRLFGIRDVIFKSHQTSSR